MAKNDSWIPPMAFYFQVQFHWGSQHIGASFMEVSGLDQEMVIEDLSQAGDDRMIKLPKEIKHGNIVLKRSLEPLDEKITSWVKSCFSYSMNGRISPCNLVISLMDAGQQEVACWACSRAYPVKWDLGILDAQKSGLVVESLTLTYNRLERKK
ncbi:phage tail protein [uncultured Sanguibacteroides sp.]|uniref:phage tail protein n=1 Tax=uncultured Sanguibacteroides sp. TaxID=1635151 RepID=UPI0025DB5F8A|nr:phage tail protein [uncultured Sanguibacteroides sp.]